MRPQDKAEILHRAKWFERRGAFELEQAWLKVNLLAHPKRRWTAARQSRPERTAILVVAIFFAIAGRPAVGVLGISLYMLYLDAVIRAEFDQKRWAMPAKVFARPLGNCSKPCRSAPMPSPRNQATELPRCELPGSAAAGAERQTLAAAQVKPAHRQAVCRLLGGASPDRAGSFARRGNV